MPSLVHMLDLHALGRLPVAVLVLASRKSMPMPWPGCVLSMTPRRRRTCPPAFGFRRATYLANSSAFRLLSRVGEGDISALGCGLTGSCSSTFQRYSLGDHLGVTASPQSPLPAGYVTLPVDGRSPPLGLMPPHSRGQGIRSVPPLLFAFQSYAHEAHHTGCRPPRTDRAASRRSDVRRFGATGKRCAESVVTTKGFLYTGRRPWRHRLLRTRSAPTTSPCSRRLCTIRGRP